MAAIWAGKRKRDDYEAEGAFDERPGSQVLPVARSLPADGIPSDGAEYLLAVRLAAERLPKFTKVHNPFHASTESSFPKPSSGVQHFRLPSLEWKTAFASRLAALRRAIPEIKLPESSVASAARYKLPSAKDRAAWYTFISGDTSRAPSTPVYDPEGEEEVEDFMETQPQIDFDNASSSDEEDARVGVTGFADDLEEGEDRPSTPMNPLVVPPTDAMHPPINPSDPVEPSLALLCRLNQFTVSQLLLYYDYWLRQSIQTPSDSSPSIVLRADEDDQAAIISPHHAKWMFALVSRYNNDLMQARDTSALRGLARACIACICHSLTREPLAPGHPDHDPGSDDEIARRDRLTGRTSLWMVIVAVVSVWGQADLWDEANEALHTNERLR